MRRALRIARREFIAAVCTKGFVIALVLAPLLMGGGLFGAAITARQDRTADRRLAVLDPDGLLGPALVEAATRRTGPGIYRVETVVPDPSQPDSQRLALSDRVRSGELHAFIEIAPGLAPSPTTAETSDGTPPSNPGIRYFARNPAIDEVRGWVAETLNRRLRQARLEAAGLDPDVIARAMDWVPVEGLSLLARDTRTGDVTPGRRQNELAAVGLPMAVVLLATLLIMMGSAPLLQSVLEEKTQRIAEVMLGAATAWEIMLGKLLGGVAVALAAMTVYLGSGFTAFTALAASHAIPWSLVPWFVAYVVAAILLFGAVALALGSACSDAKDAQNLQLPVMLPVVVPLFLLLPVIKEPQGTLATSLSLFPPFSPLLMLLRLATPEGVPTWQACLGLLGVLAATAFALWLGSRIFRVGILMQGKLPKFSQILRWGFRG